MAKKKTNPLPLANSERASEEVNEGLLRAGLQVPLDRVKKREEKAGTARPPAKKKPRR
jgi:hypothetical protein